MTRINAAGKQSCALLRRGTYWSSTENGSAFARELEFGNGLTSKYNDNKKNAKNWVRPCVHF